MTAKRRVLYHMITPYGDIVNLRHRPDGWRLWDVSGGLYQAEVPLVPEVTADLERILREHAKP